MLQKNIVKVIFSFRHFQLLKQKKKNSQLSLENLTYLNEYYFKQPILGFGMKIMVVTRVCFITLDDLKNATDADRPRSKPVKYLGMYK